MNIIFYSVVKSSFSGFVKENITFKQDLHLNVSKLLFSRKMEVQCSGTVVTLGDVIDPTKIIEKPSLSTSDNSIIAVP